MIELPLKTPITLFVKIKGERGERELQAILDTHATHMTIPYQHAVQLGYNPLFDPISPMIKDGRETTVSTIAGDLIVSTITLQKVEIGDLVAEEVEAIVWDTHQDFGVEMVLGISFLKNFKTTLDYEKGILRIEKIGP